MSTRYTLNVETGLLTDRDGNTLGSVISITIDDAPLVRAGVARGGERGVGLTLTTTSKAKTTPPTPKPTAAQREAEAVRRVWDRYLELIPSGRKLDAKRTRAIVGALRLAGEEGVKEAVLGLSRSPHHNGQNEQRRKYLEIRYALKGIGNESDDERIEKARAWAVIHSPAAVDVDGAKIERWLEEVRYTASLPHHPERERGNNAYRQLRESGFTVIKLDRSPWIRIER